MILVIGIPGWQPAPDEATSGRSSGSAVEVARAAVADGARVELVGKVGEDEAGEQLLLDLARAGIGHAALLRDAGSPTLVLPAAGAAEDAIPDDELAELVGGEVDLALVAGDVGSEAGGSNGRVPDEQAITSKTRALTVSGPVLEPADLELALRYLVDFRVLVIAEDLSESAARVVADGAAFAGASLVVVASPGSVPALPDDATVFERPSDDPDAVFAGLVGRYATALDRGEAPEEAFREATAEHGWEPAG